MVPRVPAEVMDYTGDMRDIVGPDRVLPCGCHVINGAICLVSHVKIDMTNVVLRPGRMIYVNSRDADAENTP